MGMLQLGGTRISVRNRSVPMKAERSLWRTLTATRRSCLMSQAR